MSIVTNHGLSFFMQLIFINSHQINNKTDSGVKIRYGYQKVTVIQRDNHHQSPQYTLTSVKLKIVRTDAILLE